jgi:hypothetical protein
VVFDRALNALLSVVFDGIQETDVMFWKAMGPHVVAEQCSIALRAVNDGAPPEGMAALARHQAEHLGHGGLRD